METISEVTSCAVEPVGTALRDKCELTAAEEETSALNEEDDSSSPPACNLADVVLDRGALTYLVDGYLPLQNPPAADLVKAHKLLGYIKNVLSTSIDVQVRKSPGRRLVCLVLAAADFLLPALCPSAAGGQVGGAGLLPLEASWRPHGPHHASSHLQPLRSTHGETQPPKLTAELTDPQSFVSQDAFQQKKILSQRLSPAAANCELTLTRFYSSFLRTTLYGENFPPQQLRLMGIVVFLGNLIEAEV